VNRFLHANNLLAVVRGHEAQDNGYRLYGADQESSFPSVITIFSAPNYCDVYNNKGAIIKYDNEVLNIRQFKEVPHPYYLPKFMNAFDWSLPFLGEKVAELLMAVLQIPTLGSALEGLTLREREKLDRENEERDRTMREKVLALGKIGQMYNNIRADRESLTELENVVGLQNLPGDELVVGDDILRSAITSFDEARESDIGNEKLPDRGTLSISPIPEVSLEFPSPKLAALTDDDIVSEISSASSVQEKSTDDL
jgi:serine/threonine-protein phosphatase 2B catalytic subunit